MSRVGEVLFFRNSHFFDDMWLGIDFCMIFGGFWEHFGSQNAFKMGEKIDKIIDLFLDGSWKGSGAPKVVLTTKIGPYRVHGEE